MSKDDTVETLGTILTGEHGRDAIHVAVIPAIASEWLRPGEHVGLNAVGKADTAVRPRLGVVDPFLFQHVKPDERFWIFIYPRQITGLRHVWTHPLLPDEGKAATPAAPPEPKKPTKEESEAWLQDFISRSDCPDYDTVIELALSDDRGWSGEALHFNDMDAHGDIPDEFWDHLENLKGRKLKRAKYFSCSC